VNGRPMISPPLGEDTLELELTPEQMLGLSQAAEAARLVAPTPTVVEPGPLTPVLPSPQPPPAQAPAPRSRQWHETPIAKMAASTAVFVAFAWWSGSRLAGQPQPQPHATAVIRPATAAVIPQPAMLTESAPPTVKIVNPFDRTEVFEFPAGTSEAESREKVAQILLQRAHDRQSQWERVKPKVTVRTASVYRAP
jgi:hypothetical protein